jgi:flagellin-like protein
LLIVQLIISGVKKYSAGFPVRVPLTWREKHMDIKKLFMNNKAVSPVIGVILMVAITVILAAAIGSSVFGQGTAESAPQANLDIQADGIKGYGTGSSGYDAGCAKFEHLGGDPVNFQNGVTKIVASVNGDNSKELYIPTELKTLEVGNVQTIPLLTAAATPLKDKDNSYIASGDVVKIKIIDVKTSQLICDKDLRF